MSNQKRTAEIEARLKGHPNENYNSAKSLKDKDIEYLLKANAILLNKLKSYEKDLGHAVNETILELDALGGENET